MSICHNTGMYSGPLNTFIIEVFQVGMRYRLAALSYSLGMGFIGGTTHLIASLLSQDNNYLLFCLYVCIAGILALLGL